jgi:hypothetical protein
MGLRIFDTETLSSGNYLSGREPSLNKKQPCEQIIAIYKSNCERLSSEVSKLRTDKLTKNNIAAYTHIIKSLEEEYDLEKVNGTTKEPLVA